MQTRSKEIRIGRNRYSVQVNSGAESLLVPLTAAECFTDLVLGAGWSSDETYLISEGKSFGKGDELLFGSGISGENRISITNRGPVFLSVLMQDLSEIMAENGGDPEKIAGVVIRADESEAEFAFSHRNGKPAAYSDSVISPLLLAGFFFREPEHIPREDAHLRQLCEFTSGFECGGGISLWAYAPLPAGKGDVPVQPGPESMLRGSVQAKIYQPARTADAADLVKF